jgi:hypothetical protein
VNDILRPVTVDGMAGFDQFNQFYIKWKEGDSTYGSTFHDVREKICCICSHGWELTAKSLKDQTFVDHRAEHAHLTCSIRYEALQEYDFWYRSLIDVGFMFGPIDNNRYIAEGGAAIESIPNGYWPKGDLWGQLKPWYRVRLLKRLPAEKQTADERNCAVGRTLKLGARKSVYHMEIEPGPGDYDYKLAQELLGNEKVYGNVAVTMAIRADGAMIHAHGKEKAKEYLAKFKKILGVKAYWEEKEK